MEFDELSLGPGGILAPSWEVLVTDIHLSKLGSKLEDLEGILAPSFEVLRPSWLHVGCSWGHFRSKLGGLGTFWLQV